MDKTTEDNTRALKDLTNAFKNYDETARKLRQSIGALHAYLQVCLAPRLDTLTKLIDPKRKTHNECPGTSEERNGDVEPVPHLGLQSDTPNQEKRDIHQPSKQ